MKHEKRFKNKKLIAAIAIVSAIVIIAGGFYIAEGMQAQAEATAKANRPAFSFEASKASDWWSADNNYPTKEDYAEETDAAELPVVNMNISQGTRENPGTCFVMYFYKAGLIDTAAALQAIKDESVGDNENLSFNEISTHPMTISTSEGVKDYTLYQYELSGPASASMAKGAQFAYVSLENGFIEIKGYCEVAADLANTMQAFSAVSFKSSNN